jgi:hypothetical protein
MPTSIKLSPGESDGSLELREEDVDALGSLAPLLDAQIAAQGLALGYTACVTCLRTGERHTIQALNYVHALAKAALKCPRGFQMSTGPC